MSELRHEYKVSGGRPPFSEEFKVRSYELALEFVREHGGLIFSRQVSDWKQINPPIPPEQEEWLGHS